MRARQVGFPAVLKPTGGAASIGVLRVDDAAQLLAGFRRVRSELSRCVANSSGVLVQIAAGEPVPDGCRAVDCALMLEEYLDGTEIDCDVVLDEGVPVYSRITDNWPTYEPWFNETGDNCPSLLPPAAQAEMVTLCTGTLAALGFTTGVFHVEGKVTARGPRLIEVNARMGGGQARSRAAAAPPPAPALQFPAASSPLAARDRTLRASGKIFAPMPLCVPQGATQLAATPRHGPPRARVRQPAAPSPTRPRARRRCRCATTTWRCGAWTWWRSTC